MKKPKKRKRLSPKDALLVWAGINYVKATLDGVEAEILYRRVLKGY
jgi:hypothetical protein